MITVSDTSNYQKNKKICLDEEDLEGCIDKQRRTLIGRLKGTSHYFVDNFRENDIRSQKHRKVDDNIVFTT